MRVLRIIKLGNIYSKKYRIYNDIKKLQSISICYNKKSTVKFVFSNFR